jgi:hypothetical protein
MNKNTVRKLIEAKQAMDDATRTYAELKDKVRDLMVSEGIDNVEVDGHKVTVVRTGRRSVDAKTLKDLITASVFRDITETSVHLKLFDAAVLSGKIDQGVVEQVVSKNEIVQVHVK